MLCPQGDWANNSWSRQALWLSVTVGKIDDFKLIIRAGKTNTTASKECSKCMQGKGSWSWTCKSCRARATSGMRDVPCLNGHIFNCVAVSEVFYTWNHWLCVACITGCYQWLRSITVPRKTMVLDYDYDYDHAWHGFPLSPWWHYVFLKTSINIS